ncbi:para-nitrobenzyl esterase-like isoform 2-T2 [Anomaloglossus baeobatrachus]|uniref:para-nitrobenzyl esterase-like isoform X2 n=1 Tax=Anomaloglossus baeobatrachus TaxID=238106 RepID=UPI003F5073AA
MAGSKEIKGSYDLDGGTGGLQAEGEPTAVKTQTWLRRRVNSRGEAGSQSEFKYLVDDDEEEEEEEEEGVKPFLDSDPSDASCSAPSYKTQAAMFGGVVALGLVVVGLAYLSGNSACTVVDVITTCGKVRGQHCEKVYMFKGIPYASPPTGSLRWRPPKEPTCWNDTLDATEFRSVCPQVRPLSETGEVMGSEDCLHANVWTPSMDENANLPVMVWIHGGYLLIGSGCEPGYGPNEDLAQKSQIVHVSFNYRLNALGFMALETLREGSPTNSSGNYGFMDQIAALRWVQKNIRSFGGDPNQVTIYGQSSGGTSVWTLMVSPLAKGLFHRAIDISGSSVFKATMAEAEKDNLVFLKRSSCRDAPCLRNLSISKILQSIPWSEYPNWAADDLCDLPQKGKFIGPMTVVDGYVVLAAPLDVWKQKIPGYSDVPYVIGTTLQEAEFAPFYPNISKWSEEDYRWIVNSLLGTFGGNLSSAALALYPTAEFCSQPERCVEKTYMTMVSDLRVSCPSNMRAQQAAEALSSPVYRYQVVYSPSRPSRIGNFLTYPSWFSFHLLDILGFFGTLEEFLGAMSDDDRAFQRLMRKYFIHFAKEGSMPPEWPEYPDGMAVLSTSLCAVKDYRSLQCDLWEQNDMFQYAWIN